ncbi:hypothetical protein [Filimonas lacunae]
MLAMAFSSAFSCTVGIFTPSARTAITSVIPIKPSTARR